VFCYETFCHLRFRNETKLVKKKCFFSKINTSPFFLQVEFWKITCLENNLWKKNFSFKTLVKRQTKSSYVFWKVCHPKKKTSWQKVVFPPRFEKKTNQKNEQMFVLKFGYIFVPATKSVKVCLFETKHLRFFHFFLKNSKKDKLFSKIARKIK